mmetsp:Transcript_99763/g.277810  ORF Transcript_99763/g.277810 Transcript_99763/m.277810 type:complete len:232 (+) Transcript_99763:642-1337(+)
MISLASSCAKSLLTMFASRSLPGIGPLARIAPGPGETTMPAQLRTPSSYSVRRMTQARSSSAWLYHCGCVRRMKCMRRWWFIARPWRKPLPNRSSSPAGSATPFSSWHLPMTRCVVPCRPCTLDGVKYFSRMSGREASTARASYCMKPRTRSQMVSLGPRFGSSRPPQKVLLNHLRSHRPGRPCRFGSPSGAQARAQSASMPARCALRKRQPTEETRPANSSYMERGTLAA